MSFEIDFRPFSTTIVCCDLYLSDYTSCSRHLRIHFESNPDLIVKCRLCADYVGPSIKSLNNHIKVRHSTYHCLVVNSKLCQMDVSEPSSSKNSNQFEFETDPTPIDHLQKIKLNLMNEIFELKSKFAIPHCAASEIFLSGMDFCRDLLNGSDISDWDYAQLIQLAKSPAKQTRMTLDSSDSSYMTDCAEIGGEILEWYYFPVLSVIMEILLKEDEYLLEEIVKENGRETFDGIYKGFKDGQLFRREVLQPGVIECRIQLYIDDVRKTKNKATEKTNICVVLMIIENAQYFYQSSREDISVLMIGTHYTYEKVGKNRFLKKIIDELIGLKNRPIILNSGKYPDKYLKIKVVAFNGDNKALNEMMNISKSFSNSACCRFCMANNDLMQTLSQFDLLIRNLPIDHILQGICDHEMCYAVDFFHDMTGNIRTLITQLIFNCYSSSSDKEQLMQIINQSHFENGKIALNFNQKKINYTSASQLFEFFIRFSYFDFVCLDSPTYSDAPEYKLYWLLRKVYNVYSKFEITEEELESADKNVRELIQKCINLNIRIKPKMHNLLHYKQFVQRYGSIVKHSTLRFERKNQELIRNVQTSQNNKDVPFSIAQWCVIKKSLNSEPERPKFKLTHCSDHLYSDFINVHQPVREYREYMFKKVLFKTRKFFILNKTLSNELFVGQVVKIFEQNEVLKIVCLKYQSTNFDKKRLLYKLNFKEEMTLLDLNCENLYHIHLYVIESLSDEPAILFKTF